MTDFTRLIESHPSARVRQLLASADLDVPSAGGKQRALVAVSNVDHRIATTNFSGIALGTSVHRLIGAVTLYGSKASPFRLIRRGSLVGAAAGALALATIVMLRWTGAPAGTTETTHALTQAPSSPVVARHIVTESSELESLQAAELDLEAGRTENALAHVRAFMTVYPASSLSTRAVVLEVKALVRLERMAEAANAAKPVLVAGPSAEASQLRALVDPHRGTPPADSTK